MSTQLNLTGANMQHFLEGVGSYILALFLMFGSHLNDVVSWGGLLLLVIRLIADAPRAWASLRGKHDGS